MVQWQNRDRRAEADSGGSLGCRGHEDRRVRNGSPIEQEMVLGEPEAVPTQLLGQLYLVENALVEDVERRVPVREVRWKQMHVESHGVRSYQGPTPGVPLKPDNASGYNGLNI